MPTDDDYRRWYEEAVAAQPPTIRRRIRAGVYDHMIDDPPIPIGVRLPDGRIIRGKTDAETLELLRAEGVEIPVPVIPDRAAPADDSPAPRPARKRRVPSKT